MNAPAAPATVSVGIDIGGTFTDIFVIDARDGSTEAHKVLTDHADPAAGIERGLRDLLAAGSLDCGRVARVSHGTTLVTNAVIQRRGAPTALLATHGFRDSLEIGTEHRYDLYDLGLDKPEPIVPRRWRRTVRERVLADGRCETPLDEAGARAAISALLDDGVTSIAVCFLHSYRNPAHEQRIAELAQELEPAVHVSLSSEIAPEIREYERSSTTAINAFVAPLVAPYLDAVSGRLEALGIAAPLLVMQSNGGTATPATARRHPVRLLESGPAAGAIGAARVARDQGEPRVLFFDMGGTTAKAAIIEDGAPIVARQLEVAHVYRFKAGSGLPVQAPSIDMIEIGAGGGSIARVDDLGLIKVGPDSAESEPGPACYGLGGSRPTVTDADLVLGYLGADSFLGGRMRLDVEAARRAIATHVAEPLGIAVDEAALGIHRIVNENMAAAARLHLLDHGRTPSSFTMVAFGGAGPVHAYGVARILGIGKVLVPVEASVGSAVGLLCAPVAFEKAQSFPAALEAVDWQEVRAVIDGMVEACASLVGWAGVDRTEMTDEIAADMRYRGQGHEITIPLRHEDLAQGIAAIRRAFVNEYERFNGVFGYEAPVERVTLRARVAGPLPMPTVTTMTARGRDVPSRHARPVRFDDAGPVIAEVVPLASLDVGESLAGPAIVELGSASISVGPDASVVLRGDGIFALALPGAGA